jgi:hypothetical protein
VSFGAACLVVASRVDGSAGVTGERVDSMALQRGERGQVLPRPRLALAAAGEHAHHPLVAPGQVACGAVAGCPRVRSWRVRTCSAWTASGGPSSVATTRTWARRLARRCSQTAGRAWPASSTLARGLACAHSQRSWAGLANERQAVTLPSTRARAAHGWSRCCPVRQRRWSRILHPGGRSARSTRNLPGSRRWGLGRTPSWLAAHRNRRSTTCHLQRPLTAVATMPCLAWVLLPNPPGALVPRRGRPHDMRVAPPPAVPSWRRAAPGADQGALHRELGKHSRARRQLPGRSPAAQRP